MKRALLITVVILTSCKEPSKPSTPETKAPPVAEVAATPAAPELTDAQFIANCKAGLPNAFPQYVNKSMTIKVTTGPVYSNNRMRLAMDVDGDVYACSDLPTGGSMTIIQPDLEPDLVEPDPIDPAVASKPIGCTTAPLVVESWNWSESSGYAIAQGEVRNVTDRKLENVTALVRFYNAAGEMVSSDDALIEYQTLMPGQTSPFKVMEDFNPQMTNARLEFKEFAGGQIESIERKECN